MSASPSDESSQSGTAAPPKPAPRGRVWLAVVVLVVVVVVVAGSLTYYYETRPTPSSSSPGYFAGGFAEGQVVTLSYNGSSTFACTPPLSALFPRDANASAAGAVTSCGIGNASQTAVAQIPQWYLVPGFSGLSVFGLTNFNATARGFPTRNGTAVETDCGAGATATACVDHPPVAFSPLFAQFEARAGLLSGVESLPLGTLPYPAHDIVENYTAYPLVPWGTIVVYVFDPNILPNRATGVCAPVAPSNLTDATANCLNSTAHIYAAATTCSSAAAATLGAADNPIGWVLTHEDHVSPCDQVYIQTPGSPVPAGTNELLNSNLYVPYSVSLGAPSSFPN